MTTITRFGVVLLTITSFASCSSIHQGELTGPVPAPAVLQAVPSSAVAGEEINLIGRGFGTDAMAVSVRFGSQAAQVLSLADTEITVEVPLDADGALAVSIAGEALEVKATFTYIAEELLIESFAPQEGTPGTEVTITGAGFGTRATWLEVELGGQAAQVLSCGCEELHIAVPEEAATGALTVRRGMQTVQAAGMFTITQPEQPQEPPQVLSFSPAEVWPMDFVHVTGFNFGTDLSTVRAYVGGKQALIAALGNSELLLRPVPGTAGGMVRVVTTGGEDTSADSLAVKEYPEYFTMISAVSTAAPAPGGLLGLHLSWPDAIGGIGVPGLGERELQTLAYLAESYYEDMNRVPPDMPEGEHYLGIPNLLKDEDKPEGMEDEQVWVTAYMAQPLNVTSDGRQPPQTTGLEPSVVYGHALGASSAEVKVSGVDFTQPAALLLDGEAAGVYAGGDEVGFHSYLVHLMSTDQSHFDVGEHSLTLVTEEGYGTADPGYRVASLDEVKVRIDSIEPATAHIGDIVTVKGKNLHWHGVGAYTWSPVEVSVDGVRMIHVLGDLVASGEAWDETQFVVTGDTHGGAVSLKIKGGDYTNTYTRDVESELMLTVEREYADGFDRYYLPAGTIDFGENGVRTTNDPEFSRIAETGELYEAAREMVSDDEEYVLLGYTSPDGYTNLGRIDRAPLMFPGMSGGNGSYARIRYTRAMANGDVHVAYYGVDNREEETYCEFRIVVYSLSGEIRVHPLLLLNTQTGEHVPGIDTGESPMSLTSSVMPSYDEQGHVWALIRDELLMCDEDGWHDLGAGFPTGTYPDPDLGEIDLSPIYPLYAESTGHLKMFASATEDRDRIALYFVERSISGDWTFTKVSDEETYLEQKCDRLGRARLFDTDGEYLTIRREENGFIEEPWAEIPVPANARWLGPAEDPDIRLHVVYDYLNRAMAVSVVRYATTWDQAWLGNDSSGAAVSIYQMIEEGSGGIQTHTLSAILPTRDFYDGSYLGLTVDWHVWSNPILVPSGRQLVITGARIEYVENEESSSVAYPNHSCGSYVYTQSL